jgi:hypothetical protein
MYSMATSNVGTPPLAQRAPQLFVQREPRGGLNEAVLVSRLYEDAAIM